LAAVAAGLKSIKTASPGADAGGIGDDAKFSKLAQPLQDVADTDLTQVLR